MRLLRRTSVRLAVPVLAGAVVIGGMFMPAVLSGAAEENESLGSALIGPALLLSPFLIFSAVGLRRARISVWLAILGLLVAGTVLGLLAAGSSSTGALIFLWLLPLQWIVAAVPATLRAERGPVSGPARTAEGRSDPPS